MIIMLSGVECDLGKSLTDCLTLSMIRAYFKIHRSQRPSAITRLIILNMWRNNFDLHIRLGDICEYLGLTERSVSKHIAFLVNEGLLVKVHSFDDLRISYYTLNVNWVVK